MDNHRISTGRLIIQMLNELSRYNGKYNTVK